MKAKLILDYPAIFICRLKGLNNHVREVPTLINLSYTNSIINKTTATELGYLETTARFQELEELYHDSKMKYFLTLKGIERAYILRLKQVTIGKITRRNFPVAVLEEELNPHLPVDMILGLDFFKNHRVLININQQKIKIMSSTKT
ncbi:MAG: retropepsin-like aspartic protease [Candidatus Caldarchaeum sp.]